MNDRELLEFAAKAAGIVGFDVDAGINTGSNASPAIWNPLTDDGDALRLAVKLNLSIRFDACSDGVAVDVCGEWDEAPTGAQETYERQNGVAATRRAIVRAAAEIGKAQQ